MDISWFAIDCEIEPDLKRTKNWMLSEISRTFRAIYPNANPVEYEVVTATTGPTFQINNAKLYVQFSLCLLMTISNF